MIGKDVRGSLGKIRESDGPDGDGAFLCRLFTGNYFVPLCSRKTDCKAGEPLSASSECCGPQE